MSSVAKQKQGSSGGGLLAELFRFGLYKPNQGRVVRQVTFAVVALMWGLSVWEIQRAGWFGGIGGASYLVVLGLIVAGVWFAFRVVNYPPFADFLIAVEAEMNKVSWPSRRELWNASCVVMFVIFSMAIFLFLFDALWTAVFEAIGIRYSTGDSLFVQALKYFGLR